MMARGMDPEALAAMTAPFFYANARVSLANGLPPRPDRVHDFLSEVMRDHYQRVEVALDAVLETDTQLSELSLSHGPDHDLTAPLDLAYVTTIWRGNMAVARVRLLLSPP